MPRNLLSQTQRLVQLPFIPHTLFSHFPPFLQQRSTYAADLPEIFCRLDQQLIFLLRAAQLALFAPQGQRRYRLYRRRMQLHTAQMHQAHQQCAILLLHHHKRHMFHSHDRHPDTTSSAIRRTASTRRPFPRAASA